MPSRPKHQQGLIKILFLVVIVVVILTLLKIDARALIRSDLFQSNLKLAGEILGIVINFIKDLWFDYAQAPAEYLWFKVLVPVWQKIISLF